MSQWLMVLLTAGYVIATLILVIASFKSSRTAERISKRQLERLSEMEVARQRPALFLDLEYLNIGNRDLTPAKWVLRNLGGGSAFNVRVSGLEQQVEKLKPEGVPTDGWEAMTNGSIVVGVASPVRLFARDNGPTDQHVVLPWANWNVVVDYNDSYGHEFRTTYSQGVPTYSGQIT